MSSQPVSRSPVLSAHSLAWHLPGGHPLFAGLELSAAAGWHGLVGPNGAGKTTLLELLAGVRTPHAGHVARTGAAGYLEQRPHRAAQSGAVADLLGLGPLMHALARLESGDAAPEVFDAIGDRWEEPDRARVLLARLGLAHLELERPAAQLSGGELTRVRLARLLFARPAILLLDEPTNHLDRAARAALADALAAFPGVLVVASHDRELLERADAIWELEQGRLSTVGGGFAEYAAWRETETHAARRDVQSSELALARERRDAARSADRQRHRSAHGSKRAAVSGIPKIVRGMMKRGAQRTAGQLKNLHEQRVEQAHAGLSRARARLPRERRIAVDLPDTAVPASRRLLELRDVNIAYAGRWLFPRAVRLLIAGPERVALTGPNGSGKSTLARLAAGLPLPGGAVQGGEVERSPDPVAFLDQHAALLDEGATLAENIAQHAPHLTEAERRVRLGRFLFEQERALIRVADLSGGERVRAALACLFARERPPRLLVLDEPTNHLDLDSVEALESALSGYRGALMVASHDERFLEAIGVTRRLELP